MFPAIGFRSTPKGGLGNRLLNHINLGQLSAHLNARSFETNLVDRLLVPGVHRPTRLPWRLRKARHLEREEVYRLNFFDTARDAFERGETLVLKPRLLTEAYARFDFFPIAARIRHRFQLCGHHLRPDQPASQVVLHLRGSDFAQWKPGSILGEQYYREALDYLDAEGFADSQVRVCTEDRSHPAFEPLVRRLRKQERLVESDNCLNPFSCDFASLIQADRIVSSPSTFAITAAMLGGVSVIHSEKWVDSRIADGDRFWERVRSKDLVGYEVLAEV